MPESSLTLAELTSMRAAVNAVTLTNGTAIVIRDVETLDSDGRNVTTPSNVGTHAVGLFKRVRRVEIDIRDYREAEENFYSVILPWDADIQPDDRLSIAGTEYSINILWVNHHMRVGTRARITRID